MTLKSYSISDALYLIQQPVAKKAAKAAKPVEIPTNHIVVIDCSGSMYYDLPKLREQLKKKLPKLIGDKDTVSIIWFSGRNQFGTLLEAEPVATLADLQDVNKAIDRWLKPVCLTGFKEPLEEAGRLVDRISKKNPGSVFSLFFMSDGCDNQWGRAEILAATEKAAKGLASAAFVEYGYYADRPLLSKMAEKAGGSLIFSEGFDRYEPVFEAAMGKKPTGAKKIEVKVTGDAVGGFAFAIQDNDLLTFAVEGGVVQVPEDLEQIAYLSPSAIAGVEATPMTAPLLYAAVSLFATRMNSNVVFALLKSLGDVNFIEQFTNCFGKQRYSEFQEVTKAAVFDEKLRLTKGFDRNKVPREDSFTILELLQLLANDEGNRALLDHKLFQYNRIGRGRVDSSASLTAEEQAEIDNLTEQMKKTKAASKVAELAKQISAITEAKKPPLKFKYEPAEDGYKVNTLTFAEERPNVSIQIRREGMVDISDRCPDEHRVGDVTQFDKLPQNFPTFQFRNYAIVKDGLVNVGKLPVTLSVDTKKKLDKLIQDGLAPAELIREEEGVTVLNIQALPVINRKMVKETSAKDLFELQWELTKAQAAQKVYKWYKDNLVGKRTSTGFTERYGAAATEWLKEQGFTDYSGFGPKGTLADAADFYMGKEMQVKLKGFSTLPPVTKVLEGMQKVADALSKGKASKPLTPTVELLAVYVKEVEDFINSPAYQKASNKDEILKVWLEAAATDSIKTVRNLLAKKAQTLFAVVVGQTWFSEFESLDQNSLDVTLDGKVLSFSVEMKEVEIKI